MKILGVDPGLRACGLALYEDGVWKATTIRTRPRGPGFLPRLTHIANKAKVFAGTVDILVVEMMNVHDRRSTKKDKPDLIPLSVLAGMVFGLVPHTTSYFPLPVSWKGSVPKVIHHRRLKKEVPSLAGKRVSTDAWDAVGLALYGMRQHAFISS